MYSSIVIAGGATKALAVIGIIKYLEEQNLIEHIKNFVGTSAGSIMCLFMVLGYTSQEMKAAVLEILNDKSVTSFEPDGLFDLFSSFGINSGENMETLFNKLIYKKYGRMNMKFIDMAKATGKNLVVCGSNLTKETHEYFSVDTTPNMTIAKAIRISCSIPVMFAPVEINGNLYVDGGLFNNFPIDYFSEHQLKDILGINIICKNYQKNENFLQYLRFILNSLLKKTNEKSINSKDRNIVTLEFEDDDGWFTFSEIKIYINKLQLENYIASGYNNIKLSHDSLQQT